MSNERRDINLSGEASGLAYAAILRCGLRFATGAMLVVRPSIALEPSGQRVLDSVQSLGARVKDLSEWPGTKLLDGNAKVHTFAFNERALSVLANAATSLFDWQQPTLPEDLALLRGDGTPWLTTISHERDAFLSLTQDELDKIRKECPEMASLLVQA